ncbi:MAG: YybH family protein [Chloroflexota bacterium]
MIEDLATEQQRAELREWFETWAGYVSGVDYRSARALFHPEVVGFGTYMEYVRGLDELEERQWRSIWSTISDFHFLTDRLICGVAGDGRQAWGIVPWTSTGYNVDGSTFERPGRATVLFVRDEDGEKWLAIHTHISLSPGTPPHSYAHREEKRE